MQFLSNKLQNIKSLRIIGIIEGISYIVLLAFSMPLKYLLKMQMPIKINGWLHGLLFICFIFFLLVVSFQQKWKFKKLVTGGIASLIPFGTFWFDKKITETNPNS